VHHSFSKLKRILLLVIIKTKALEIDKIHLKMHLNIFVSNVFSTLKIMNFENVFVTKVINFCIIQNMNALYINDINQDIVKSNYIQNTNVNWV
jgi:hypothetical protein